MSTKSDKAKESGVVHFSIGENMGVRLMEISQEHLIYGNDPIKALKAITDSLIGCPTDYALKILKGDIVLFVDTADQTIMPTERIPAIHDKIFPKIDVVDYMKKCDHKIQKHSLSLINTWNILKGEIAKRHYSLTVDFDFEDIFKFVSGNNEVILETLRDLKEVDQITEIIGATKAFIEHSSKIQSTLEWMFNTWNEFETFDSDSKENPYVEYIDIKENISDNLIHAMRKMQEVVNLDFKFQLDAESESIDNYINAVKEIDVVITEGIEPVDILDNWSGGWLSPEGEYYALNGEIANMLHNQIADALQEKGIIPMYENDEDKSDKIKLNPDSWLEEQGWVKIHDNNVHFAGCLNVKLDKPNVNMTDIQINMVRDYITDCHQCIIKAGWRLMKQSIGMFTALAKSDPIAFNKKYFTFD